MRISLTIQQTEDNEKELSERNMNCHLGKGLLLHSYIIIILENYKIIKYKQSPILLVNFKLIP